MKVIPTVFSKTKKEFDTRFEKLRKVNKDIQIDFMDGKFVKNKSVSVKQVPFLFDYNNIVEAHLMVKNPDEWIEPLSKRGFGRIIFHIETTKKPDEALEIIKKIRGKGMHAVVALNPATPITKIKKIASSLHHVLLMGVKPGKENQKLLKKTYEKIKKLKKEYPALTIQVDGGVNKTNAPLLKKTGADIINSGSYIYSSKNPKKALKELKNE